jgi:hypothetical protein
MNLNGNFGTRVMHARPVSPSHTISPPSHSHSLVCMVVRVLCSTLLLCVMSRQLLSPTAPSDTLHTVLPIPLSVYCL